jgi:hypothetical protein
VQTELHTLHPSKPTFEAQTVFGISVNLALTYVGRFSELRLEIFNISKNGFVFSSRHLKIKSAFARRKEWYKKLTLTDHPKSTALKANFAQFDSHMAETAKSDKHQSQRRCIARIQGKYLLF